MKRLIITCFNVFWVKCISVSPMFVYGRGLGCTAVGYSVITHTASRLEDTVFPQDLDILHMMALHFC